MATIEEQIKALEEEIFNTQKNKATEHHLGKIKAKIAKLKAQQELQKIKGGGGGRRYYIKKSGDATVALVGFPSVGKSSLLNHLTASKSEVAAYQFTTLEVIPGVMKYKGAEIQILDMPGIIKGAAKGKGRGREVITAARAADIILLLGDVFNYKLNILERELYDAGIRLDKQPPNIHITQDKKGGIIIRSTVPLTHMTEFEIADIIRAYGIVNANVTIREDIDTDSLVDFLAGNRVYIPSVVAINKFDLRFGDVENKIKEELNRDYLPTLLRHYPGPGGDEGTYLRSAGLHSRLSQAERGQSRPGRAVGTPGRKQRQIGLRASSSRLCESLPLCSGLGRERQVPRSIGGAGS